MVQRDTQGRLEKFEGALKNGKIDVGIYLQLEDLQADAIELMLRYEILTEERLGHYKFQVGLRGTQPSTRDLEHGPDRIPLFVKRKKHAKQIAEFYRNHNQQITLIKYDN